MPSVTTDILVHIGFVLGIPVTLGIAVNTFSVVFVGSSAMGGVPVLSLYIYSCFQVLLVLTVVDSMGMGAWEWDCINYSGILVLITLGLVDRAVLDSSVGEFKVVIVSSTAETLRVAVLVVAKEMAVP